MTLDQLLKIDKIAILGFGKEGKSTLRFLLELGISVNNITLIDKNKIDTEFKGKIITGDNYLDYLSEYNLIFKSPGISPYNSKILPFMDKLTSQTEIFFNNYKGKTIGITATKGKSTVSSLLYQTLKNTDFNVKLVGNIGTPVFDEINLLIENNYDYIVYELSSYMLETCKPRCDIAVLGNIYTCHLDWHNNSFAVYEQAKLNILTHSHYKIISNEFNKYGQNIDNVEYFGLESKYSFNNKFFLENNNNLFSSENLLLLGDHNKKNICSIITILSIISEYNISIKNRNKFLILIKGLESTLKTFSGLPHRMEIISKENNITFIDDGISTTPESTIEAIKTFGNKINTLFLGGGDYGFTQESYIFLKKTIHKYSIKNIVLFPDTGLDIFNINRKNKKYGDIFNFIDDDLNLDLNILYTNKMSEAIIFSYKYTGKNNICLMSCAAPSYSLWTGYEEKGKEFKLNIQKHK